jgi:pilus assembly protein CpaB
MIGGSVLPNVSQPEATDRAPALNRRLLLISVLLGAAGALLLALYLQRFELEASGGERIRLLTPAQPIERGQLITEDMLSEHEVPIAYAEPRAVRAAEKAKIIGIRASAALEPQTTLLWSDLAIATEDRDLSSLVQPGNRAVTVHAIQGYGNDATSGGLIRPGDYVDVIATLYESGQRGQGNASSIVLLQRVLVLAVGAETQPQAFADGARKQDSSERYGSLTLSLKIEETQLLSLARERGTLSVALRNPNDARIADGLPDMESSKLFDTGLRAQVQHARSVPGTSAPVRIDSANQP